MARDDMVTSCLGTGPGSNVYIHPPLITLSADPGHKKDFISVDTDSHGAIFIPVILGSDKTTTSVGTGQHEYHPIYLLVGNVHNRIR